MTKADRLVLKVRTGFSYIAFWQLLVFLMLILLVWADQVLDITALVFGETPRAPDVTRGCLATAGVLVAAIVTVGTTYLQQRRIVRGLLTICSYCKKIRVDQEVWQQVEEFIGRRSTINFTHSVCPECFQRVKEMVEIEAAAAVPPVVRGGPKVMADRTQPVA